MIEVLDRIALMLIFAVGGVLYLMFFALVAHLVQVAGAQWERAKERGQPGVLAPPVQDAIPFWCDRRVGVATACAGALGMEAGAASPGDRAGATLGAKAHDFGRRRCAASLAEGGVVTSVRTISTSVAAPSC